MNTNSYKFKEAYKNNTRISRIQLPSHSFSRKKIKKIKLSQLNTQYPYNPLLNLSLSTNSQTFLITNIETENGIENISG